LENLANKNHETPDLHPEGTKSGNSSTFVISRRDNLGYKLVFPKTISYLER